MTEENIISKNKPLWSSDFSQIYQSYSKGKGKFFKKSCKNNYIFVFRKSSTHIKLHTKITLKWTTDLNTQATIIKLQK